MKTNTATSLRGLVFGCVLGTATFSLGVAAPPTAAQSDMTSAPELSAIRLAGMWSVSGNRLRISTNYRHNIAIGFMVDRDENPVASFQLAPILDGKSLQGTMKAPGSAASGGGATRTVRLVLVRPGIADLYEVTPFGTLGPRIWRAVDAGGISMNSNKLRDFVGTWQTSLGLLEFNVEMEHLYGEIRRKGTGGTIESVLRVAADINAQPMSGDSPWAPLYGGLTGAWTDPVDPKRGGLLLLKLTQDDKGWAGEYHDNGRITKITAKRYDPLDGYGDAPAPTRPDPANPPAGGILPEPLPPVVPPQQTPPSPAPPAPTPPGATPPVVTAPPPGIPGGFKPLRRFDVRVDRVAVARGYATHQVHAFVTVRNASGSPQHFTSGFLQAVLADADGAGWERSQPYRASGEPAELFAATPVIAPGGELKVRYIFLSDVDAQLATLTLVEGDRRATFPVGGR